MFLALTIAASDAAHHAPNVPPWVTYLFAVILAAMIACLALEEKIHAKKSIIVGSFAGLCVILETILGWALDESFIPFGSVVLPNMHEVDIPFYIPAIDWGVVTIILGASLFVEVASKSGVFSWIAIKVTKLSGGDPWKLLIAYGLLTVLFSAVLNNVTAMIIIGSLTAVSLGKLEKRELLLGFLLVEGLLTNVGGLLTLISSVPNIIVGKAAGISFAKFFFVAAPYVTVATAVTLVMGGVLFKINGLKTEEEKAAAKVLVDSFDEAEGVESPAFFWFSVSTLVAFIATLSLQAFLPFGLKNLDMGFIALFYAGVMLATHKSKVDKFYQAVDWDLLAFFAALFVVINMMEHAHVLDLIGSGIAKVLALPESMASAVLLSASAIASSVTDNIPLAAMLAKILGSMPDVASDSPFWWCVIFGANLGGNITPIGSASTLVAMTIIHRNKLPLTFGGFVKLAVPFAVVQIVIAVAYVLIAL